VLRRLCLATATGFLVFWAMAGTALAQAEGGARYEGLYAPDPVPLGAPPQAGADSLISLINRITTTADTNVPGLSPRMAFQVSANGANAGWVATMQFGEVDQASAEAGTYEFVPGVAPVFLAILDAPGPEDDATIDSAGNIVTGEDGVATFALAELDNLDLGGGRTGRLLETGDPCLEGRDGSEVFLNGRFQALETSGVVRQKTERPSVALVWGFLAGVILIDADGGEPGCVADDVLVYASAYQPPPGEDATSAGFLPFAGPACVLSNGDKQANCLRNAGPTAEGSRHKRRGQARRRHGKLRRGQAVVVRTPSGRRAGLTASKGHVRVRSKAHRPRKHGPRRLARRMSTAFASR
jgi:hypothetical protein